MSREVPFGHWSLAAAGTTVLTAKGLHAVAVVPVRMGQTAAWLAVLLAGVLVLAWFWAVGSAVSRVPGCNLTALARAAAGGPGAVATGLALAATLVFYAATLLRETVELVVSALYPHTPQTFALAALLPCALYAAYGGLAALVRLCRFLLPLLLLTLLIILVGTYGWGEVHFLLPFWGPGAVPLAGTAVQLMGLYTPVVYMLTVGRALRDRRRLPRAGLVAVGATALVGAATQAVFLITHPYPLGTQSGFPVHELARLVVGGRFFERIEGGWILVWMMATAAILAAVMQAAAVVWADTFGLPRHRPAVLPLLTITTTVSLFPVDQAQTVNWHLGSLRLSLALAFGLPLLLALLARWRGRLGTHGR